MELIAYFLYLVANNWIIVMILSLLVIIAGFGRFTAKRLGLSDEQPGTPGLFPSHMPSRNRFVAFGLTLLFFAAVGGLALSVVNLIRPHLLDGYMITSIGETTEARVTDIEPTNNYLNKSRVKRHNVIFKTAAGENYETYFETWDFNTFPASSSVNYPGKGASFKVAYLPSFPSAFLILTEENSEYTKTRECSTAQKEFDAARVKTEFDPDESNYARRFREAQEKMQRLKCAQSGVERKEDLKDLPPAMTQ